MRALSLIFATTILLNNALHAQTIRRVNNTPGVTGVNVYTTIQAAHDAASNGDIILVEPSEFSYGDLECSKSLTIHGNGFFLDKNGGTLKANKLSSTLRDVTFIPGSNGSAIQGCSFRYATVEAVSNIKIARNHVERLSIRTRYNPPVGVDQNASVSDITFSQNFSEVISIGGSGTYFVSNVTITNNYLNAGGYGTVIDIRNNITNCFVRYNTINGNDDIYLENAVFENNINWTSSAEAFDVIEPLSGSYRALNSSINFNVTSANLYSANIGTGNQNAVDLSTHFISPTSSMSDDLKWKLKDDSSLKTAGTSGSEVGMYGGTTPYVVSGVPPIPAITSFRTTGTGSNTTPITVTFSAKSNN